jgi:hypothetical protein
MPLETALWVISLCLGVLAVALLFALLVSFRQYTQRTTAGSKKQREGEIRNVVEEILGDRMEDFEYRQLRHREALEERLEALLKRFGG